MKKSLMCFMRNTGPVAMAAALCVMSACASHSASVPPEKINGAGIGSVSDPAKVNDNGSSSTTSSTYANNGSYSSNSSASSSGYNTATNGSSNYNSTNSSSTSVLQGTPTTTSSTTVRQVPLPNSSLPCESMTASTRPSSAVTFYTLDPVSGIYLPAGTMSSAPSSTSTYYTYDTGNGWYTTSSSTTSGGTQIYISDPSNSTRMIPAGYAVVSTRPCGSAYVVTTTTTTSTPVNVQTTTNTTPVPPPPMTSSSSSTFIPPTIARTYHQATSGASLDVFATRMQFSGANATNMFLNGVPSTGSFNTAFERQNGWGLQLNGRLARMAELSVGGSYLKPNVTYTPTVGNFPLNAGSMTVIPLNGTVRFHLLPEAFLDPYVGGGATYMMFRDQNFNTGNGLGNTGLQSVSFENTWGWHAEGGLLLKFNHGFGINANARYNNVQPKVTSTFLNNGATTTTVNTSSFTMKPWQFSVGLRFGF
jgi:hypothetical protein